MNHIARGIARQVVWLSGIAMDGGTVGGCADGPDDQIEGQAQALNSGLRVSGLPAGLVCGLSYQYNSGIAENNGCMGSLTLVNPPVAGFNYRSVGDRGLNATKGFAEQVSRGSGAASSSNSDRLTLLRGTACGFKEQCNNSGELCLGFDPAISCPLGWTQRTARDADGGACHFFWCEYTDPNQVCCDGNSCDPACATAMPSGTACGMSDLIEQGGAFCGMSFAACPAGFHNTKGRYDWGRPSGNGISWCTKD